VSRFGAGVGGEGGEKRKGENKRYSNSFALGKRKKVVGDGVKKDPFLGGQRQASWTEGGENNSSPTESPPCNMGS